MQQKYVYQLNVLGMFGIASVLFAGIFFQFALNELPCPLCLLQRVGFALVLFGFALNVRFGIRQRHYGVILLGALFGAMSALRQVSLHVIPGTPHYGSDVMGMHYYTWAFVIFGLTILGVSVLNMLWQEKWSENSETMTKIGKYCMWFAIGSVFLNFVLTFAECGPYECAADPVKYWLFS
ncbi:disulfide bond formation protein B [Veronia pacifica]|uniref:Disulfide bond formation protein B n=1 Tax=Veronia pacifica TaxID=1080227 RepID=A0A1C3EST0_9GAMM|nr:disulfide bond formation protein B [Veronia pacifica]ODA36264.1 hypothetical protein A8L45_01300 [Veronia pacifica]